MVLSVLSSGRFTSIMAAVLLPSNAHLVVFIVNVPGAVDAPLFLAVLKRLEPRLHAQAGLCWGV
jgi:hypothetical protein